MILQKDILDKLAKERASRDTEEGKKFTEKHKSQIASFQYFLINGEQIVYGNVIVDSQCSWKLYTSAIK